MKAYQFIFACVALVVIVTLAFLFDPNTINKIIYTQVFTKVLECRQATTNSSPDFVCGPLPKLSDIVSTK